MQHAGKILIIIGILTVAVGVVIYFAGDKLRWLGHLPGDIRFGKENISIYFPITTMIIFSALLSLILWLIKKFF